MGFFPSCQYMTAESTDRSWQYTDFSTLLCTKKKHLLSADSWPAVPFPPAAYTQPCRQHTMATPQSGLQNTLDHGRALSSCSRSRVWLEMGYFSIFKDASIIWRLSKSFPYNFPWKKWDVFSPQESVQMVTHEAPIPQSSSRSGN